MFENKKLEEENKRLRQEVMEKNRIIKFQKTLINNLYERKKEYEKIIIKKAISLEMFLKKQEDKKRKNLTEDEEETL